MQLMQGINMFNYLPTHSLKKNRVSVTPGTNNIARPAIFPVKPGRVGVVGWVPDTHLSLFIMLLSVISVQK